MGSHWIPAGELVTVPPGLNPLDGLSTRASRKLAPVPAQAPVPGPAPPVQGPNVMVLVVTLKETVWSIFDGTSGCGGVVTCGVGFSSAAKP